MSKDNYTSPGPLHQVVGCCGICCPSRNGMPPDTEGCILPEGHDSPHQYIAEGSRVTWETDLDCDCDDCLRSDSFADNCLVYDIAPNTVLDRPQRDEQHSPGGGANGGGA